VGLYILISGLARDLSSYRYLFANTPRLGPAGPDGIGLAEARAKRDQMLAGVDPVAVRWEQEKPSVRLRRRRKDG
jgi:hypothetical protein